MHDTDRKSLPQIHIILGSSNVAKRMGVCLSVSQIGEPFAEQTKMDWLIMSSSRENDWLNAGFTKTSVNDYGKLCDTDVLGSQESHYKHDYYFIEKGKKGWYGEALVLQEGNLPVENNKNDSLGRCKSLVKNLKRESEIHKAYDTVIQE